MRGCFVTGTDTGVGKTAVAAAIAAALRARGERVIAHKPVLTGTAEVRATPDADASGSRLPGEARPADEAWPADEVWPPDDVVLAAASGSRRSQVTQLRFGPPVSPHLAAQLEGRPPIDATRLVTGVHRAASGADAAVVEGVGGLLVPLTPGGYTVRDLARELALPVVVAARPALGTISHTLLTLEAARAAGLEVRSVVITPWPAEPGPLEHSNARTIEALGGVPVHVLPRVRRPAAAEFVRAAASLPIDAWLGAESDRRLGGSDRAAA